MLYHELTEGRDSLQVQQYGKPQPVQYRYCEEVLRQQAKTLGWIDGNEKDGEGAYQLVPFMMGDNPAADMRGAVNAGGEWTGILVCTGVFDINKAQANGIDVSVGQMLPPRSALTQHLHHHQQTQQQRVYECTGGASVVCRDVLHAVETIMKRGV